MRFDSDTSRELLEQVAGRLTLWLPTLGGALLLVALGWLVARLSQAILGGLLSRLGIDRLARRAGLQKFLEALPNQTSASALLARLVYYVLLLVFVMAAVESLGLSGVSQTLGQLVSYLPNVIAAAVVFLFGGLASRALGDLVGAAAVQRGGPDRAVLGTITYYALLVVIAIISLQLLGVETDLLVILIVSFVAASGTTLALAFGLGNRDLARNLMAGLHAREEFQVGQQLQLRDTAGRLVRIGSAKATFETDQGQLSVPNHRLMDEEVLVLEPAVGPGSESGSAPSGDESSTVDT